jgi:shikimate dehydrogenase
MSAISGTISGRAKKAGVMGWPVGHSKSPALHGYWLAAHNIDGAYVPMAVSPENLEKALKSLHVLGFSGVNLTVPHKESALRWVDDVTPEAKAIGAINTVFVLPDGRLRGHNTDSFGFIENLKHADVGFDAKKGPSVVLGAGGAARAVCVALRNAGAPLIYIVNRTAAKSETLAKEFGACVKSIPWDGMADVLADAALLVNATSLGMDKQPSLTVDLSSLPKTAIVTDLVYAPLETELLLAAKKRGNPTVDGLGMLLYQAQAGFEGWFGIKPQVTPGLRQHVLSAT